MSAKAWSERLSRRALTGVPPKIYAYDLLSNTRTDYSSNYSLLNETVGIRSAGSKAGVSILAGPALNRAVGICLFATDGSTFAETCDSRYTDVRQWVTFNGDLYTGVQAADGTGRILHWLNGGMASPFAFEEVGATDAEVAYLTVLGNQMYVTTWGGGNSPNPLSTPSGLYVSPSNPTNASLTLSPTNPSNPWTKIWNVNNYEVDPVTATSLVGGAVESYQGQIYWGLMQIPLTGFLAFEEAHGMPPNTAATLTAIVNTARAIPIFRYKTT
jgi:hypothetical protein